MSQTNTANPSNWMHEKLSRFMGPSLLVLISSSIFRGLLGIVIGALSGELGAYVNWNPWIRLPIEIVVFLGVFISADICFANAIGNVNTYKAERRALLEEEPPVPPKYKGEPDQVARQVKAYDQMVANWEKMFKRKEKAVNRELNTETIAQFVFAFISISYAINFVLQSLITYNAQWTTIELAVIEMESIVASVYVLWYFSGRYKQSKADPVETASDLIQGGVQGRLEKAATRFGAGEQTEADLKLADAALPAKHQYRRLVSALRTLPASNDVLTTKQIFAKLGATDPNTQRRIRNALARANKIFTPGVIKEQISGSKSEWRITGEAFYKVLGGFIDELANRQAMDTEWTQEPRKRAPIQAHTGQRPDTDRTNTPENPSTEEAPIVEETTPEIVVAPAPPTEGEPETNETPVEAPVMIGNDMEAAS